MPELVCIATIEATIYQVAPKNIPIADGIVLPPRARLLPEGLECRQQTRGRRLPSDELEVLTARLGEALASAQRARLGLPSDLESLVRTYARAHRDAGSNVGAVLIEVKALVRDHAGFDAPIFTPKVVGWTVAGFYAGTTPGR